MDTKVVDTEKFYIKTKLEQKDYRKLVLFSIFIKNRCTFPIILGISLLVSLGVCYALDSMSIVPIALYTLLYFVIAFLTLLVKAEFQRKKMIKSDNAGLLNTLSHLKLYENYVVIQKEKLEGYTKIEYNKFFQVAESRYFYFLYITHNQAYVIRKDDVEDIKNLSIFLKEKFGKKYLKY